MLNSQAKRWESQMHNCVTSWAEWSHIWRDKVSAAILSVVAAPTRDWRLVIKKYTCNKNSCPCRNHTFLNDLHSGPSQAHRQGLLLSFHNLDLMKRNINSLNTWRQASHAQTTHFHALIFWIVSRYSANVSNDWRWSGSHYTRIVQLENK